MAQAAWGTPPSRLGKKQQQPSNLTGTHMMPLAQAAWGTPPSHLGMNQEQANCGPGGLGNPTQPPWYQ